MKLKRILSLIFIVTVIATMMMATTIRAKAATARVGQDLNFVQNPDSDSNSGEGWSWDGTKLILTLNGINFDKSRIEVPQGATIKFHGNNYISTTANTSGAIRCGNSQGMTFVGESDATLNVTDNSGGYSFGLNSNGLIDIQSGTININITQASNDLSTGIYADYLVIQGGAINITSNKRGITYRARGFELKGGSLLINSSVSAVHSFGSDDPAFTGKAFKGKDEKGNYTVRTVFENQKLVSATNKSIIKDAKWIPNYTMKFNNQGANVAGTSSLDAKYDEMPSNINIPAKTGHTFLGYYSEVNGQGIKFYDGNGKATVDALNPELDFEDEITLYANWAPIKYTITVNAGANGTVTGGATVNYGEDVILTATPNQDYKFKQWNDGNTSNPRQITVSANATYTAEFEEDFSVNLSHSKSDAVLDQDGKGIFRFITKVELSGNAPEIEYFGTYIIPASMFETNGFDKWALIKYEAPAYTISNNQTYSADLTDIPEDYLATDLYAISFIKFKGMNTKTSVISVNGNVQDIVNSKLGVQ